jgi:hypothetical protein
VPASEVSWRRLAELPAPDRPDETLDEMYRQHLEGKLVRGTYAEARDFFRRIP